MAYPFITISSNVTSLNSGSYYSEKDLSTFNISQSKDTFFGNSDRDIIEFAVYDISGNLINWKILPKQDTYSVISGVYKDVYENEISYNYKKFNTSYTISRNNQILLNTLSDLNSIGIKNGNQVVSYNFLRNVAGNDKYKLVIKSISGDRKEIQLIPSFNLDLTNEENVVNSILIEGFSRKMIIVSDIINSITTELNNFNVSKTYKILSESYSSVILEIEKIFGLTNETDVVTFLTKIYEGYSLNFEQANGTIVNKSYDGIKKYITNWMYTYYRSLTGVSDLKTQLKSIIDTSVKNNLKILNFNYETLDTTNSVTAFIDVLFYHNFISPVLDIITTQYNTKYYSYLKNSLNFGNNTFLPILDHSYISNTNNETILIVKLHDYLPSDISLRDTCWISNIANVPLIQKVVLSYPIEKKRHKIAGPNFKAKLDNQNNSRQIDYKSKNQLKLDDTKNQIDFNKKLQSLNVDYTTLSNFILFSSAQLRIKLFKNKLNQLNSLNTQLSTIQTNVLAMDTYVSASYSYDNDSITKEIDSIYNSFDGYESYLYKNQDIVNDINYTTYLNDAIEYDFNNRDSLINNTPEYINSDDENSDYLVFLSMAGHFFDNIYLYIQNFPTTQYVNHSNSGSFISNIANTLLEQFGWNPISSVDNNSLEHYYLNSSEHSSSMELSGVDKMKSVWNRILTNLPMIYKTKGTEESIRLLSNIYGISSNLVKVKEFGGNSLSTEDKNSYTFDKKYYFTKYSGSNEYVKLPYGKDVKSLEFKFKIDKEYGWNDRIYLVYKDNNFQVYLDKNKEYLMGKLTFKLFDQIFTSDPLPFFNEKIYNVLVKKSDLTMEVDPDIDGNSINYPNFYSLNVNCVEEDRVIFQSNNEKILNNSYAGYFSSSNYIYFGNHPSGANNFYGNIDKINIWKTEIGDTTFVDHCKNFDAYDDGNSEYTYDNLYFGYSFEYPENMASSSIVPIYNFNKLYNTAYNSSGSAYNFPNNSTEYVSCSYVPTSVFPYQFDEIDIRQNIAYKSLGPNKFKNAKINRINQSALARLMPDEKSTTDINISNDSNLVAVYTSPYSIKDDDIINFLGDYDLMNEIGDPKNLYKNKYDELTTLRKNYNKYNLAERVLYQEFITIYKNYIDPSFFESLKQLIPARSKLIRGVLVEPSLLERNKYEHRPIDSALAYDLDISKSLNSGDYYRLTSSFVPSYTSSIYLNESKHGNYGYSKPVNYLTRKTDCINDSEYVDRYSIFPINNGVYTKVDENGYNVYYVYKTQVSSSIVVLDDKTGGDVELYKSFDKYYIINSGSSEIFESASNFAINRDYVSYPLGHLSTKRNNMRYNLYKELKPLSTASILFKKSSQNNSTTVGEDGIPNGKSPVEVTATGLLQQSSIKLSQ